MPEAVDAADGEWRGIESPWCRLVWDDSGVRPPPACLPGPNSPKWHNRRTWDSLGYLRVRSLGNPNWRRDTDWLVSLLRREDRSPHLDDAIRAARHYEGAAPKDRDHAWDTVLESIDRFLEARQEQHLRAVADAGCSGFREPGTSDFS
jgi:hypothetical protein